MVRRIVVWPIRLYQYLISPWLGRRCRFSPSCSGYAVDAISQHGVVVGLGLTGWRLLKCHPFHPGGHDPVPSCRPSGMAVSPGTNLSKQPPL